jgi:capsular exopolysaccharide synthesis family protein
VASANAAHRAPPAALSASPNLTALLQAWQRRWRLALGLGLLVAAVAAVAMWVMRPLSHTARTIVHVAPTQPSVVWPTQAGGSDFGSYQRAQVALIKSRLVLLRALRDPKVAALPTVLAQADPVAWLEDKVQADFSIAPENLRITITGPEGGDLKILVAAVRDAYLAEIVNRERNARLKRLDKLKKLYAEYDRLLQEKRDTLKNMAKGLGSADRKLLVTRQELALKHIHQLQGDLLKLQSELRSCQLELAVHEARDRPPEILKWSGQFAPLLQAVHQARETLPGTAFVPETDIESQLEKDLVVVGYRTEITRREREIAGFKDRSPNPNADPGYKRALAALAEAKKALAERRRQLRPEVVATLAERSRAQEKSTLLLRRERMTWLQEMEKRLLAEIDLRNQAVDVLKSGTVNLEWLQDEIGQVDKVSKEVGRQKQVLEVEIDAEDRVTLLEEEIVLPGQTTASRFRMASLAGLAGLGAVFFSVALLEFRARRVGSVDEITHGLKLKLVGSLPVVPRRALTSSAGPSGVYWQNRLTEAVDGIRTALLNAARFENLRVVMVTSAVGGEGKTLLSCHLAASLARAGCKTLLIDGDLRRPAVHRLFGLSQERGLGEILCGETAVADVVQEGLVDGLSVITAGQSGNEAVQALARGSVGEILRGLRDAYDFIVIDSAPVLPVADSQAIGQHADGVVFSVMRGVSRLPEVYAACERLAMLRVRILGTVVNGTSAGAYGSSSYYASPATPQQGA